MEDTASVNRRLNEILYREPEREEVTATDDWHWVYIPGRGGLILPIARVNCSDVLIEGDEISFTHRWTAWEANAEAAGELKTLLASWREKGWDAEADAVEFPEGCDKEVGQNMLNALGRHVSKEQAERFPVSACKFYREPIAVRSFWCERARSWEGRDD